MRGARTPALILGLFLANLGAAPLAAQENTTFDKTNRDVVGDWVVECIQGAPQQPGSCQLYQRVLTQDPNTAAMVAALAWSPSENLLRLQVSLPLGADLRAPPVLNVDGNAAANFTWSRCLASGCLIEERLSREVLIALYNGESASITVVIPNSGGVDIPLSLDGFNDGLAQIMPSSVISGEASTGSE